MTTNKKGKETHKKRLNRVKQDIDFWVSVSPCLWSFVVYININQTQEIKGVDERKGNQLIIEPLIGTFFIFFHEPTSLSWIY